MAPHDSDSSGDEQEDYTETNVLLGYASKEPEDISRLGGRPEWIDPEEPPSAALARCRACGDLMVLLLQLNAELPTDFPGHERRLYVFACRRASCRRKDGSIRALRGVRVEPGTGASNNNSRSEKKTEDKKTKAEEPKPPVTNLGETLFGAKTLGTSSASANPFASPNPFSGRGAPAPTTSHEAAPDTKNGAPSAPAPSAAQEEMQTLPKTFAETLSLNNPQETSTHTATASAPAAAAAKPAPHEPWPPESEQPRPYPVSYLTDAEYETLDPTPAPVSQATTTVQMDVDVEAADDVSGGGKKGGKKSSGQDRDVFESSMDAAFQKFADRLAQNPEQAIRYEFRGQPLLCSRADSVGTLLLGSGTSASAQETGGVGVTTNANAKGMPRCGACGARRVFEVQLCPHAIAELEADDLSLDGMDWATVVVGVCERDCRPAGVPEGQAAYLEEWAGVQWEELTTGGRR